MSNKSIFTVVCVMLLAFAVWGNYNLQQQNNILKQTQESERQASRERDSDAMRSVEQMSKDIFDLQKRVGLLELGIKPSDLKKADLPTAAIKPTPKRVVRVAADHAPGEDEVIIKAGAPE